MNQSWQDSISATPVGLTPTTNADEPSDRMGLGWLVVAALVTVAAWQLPYGNYIAYPFTILATWFHEMGHGLTALLMGGHFDRLLIFPDGSGVAYHSAPVNQFLWGRFKDALIAIGGPMGPPIAGAAFIIASRRFKTAHSGLVLLGGLMIVSTLLWVRSVFGLVAIPLMGLIIILIALRAPRWAQGFAIQLLGVQACISTFHQLNYLLTSDAVIGGRLMLSDSGQVAYNLLLPYWFWGGLMAFSSFVLLSLSLYIRYRPERSKLPTPTI